MLLYYKTIVYKKDNPSEKTINYFREQIEGQTYGYDAAVKIFNDMNIKYCDFSHEVVQVDAKEAALKDVVDKIIELIDSPDNSSSEYELKKMLGKALEIIENNNIECERKRLEGVLLGLSISKKAWSEGFGLNDILENEAIYKEELKNIAPSVIVSL